MKKIGFIVTIICVSLARHALLSPEYGVNISEYNFDVPTRRFDRK